MNFAGETNSLHFAYLGDGTRFIEGREGLLPSPSIWNSAKPRQKVVQYFQSSSRLKGKPVCERRTVLRGIPKRDLLR